MRWLWKFLEDEPESPILVAIGILFCSALCLLNTYLWIFLYFEYTLLGLRFVRVDMFVLFFYFALMEEIQFRALWFFMVIFAYQRGYISKRLAGILIFVFLIVVSFFYFGLGHYPGEWLNLAIQGVAGVIFAITYLKFGGIKGKIFKPLMVATLAHALYNFCVLCIVVTSNPHL